jgi:hypothetical protein
MKRKLLATIVAAVAVLSVVALIPRAGIIETRYVLSGTDCLDKGVSLVRQVTGDGTERLTVNISNAPFLSEYSASELVVLGKTISQADAAEFLSKADSGHIVRSYETKDRRFTVALKGDEIERAWLKIFFRRRYVFVPSAAKLYLVAVANAQQQTVR